MEHGSDGDVAHVQIAADAARRQGAVASRRGGCKSDDAGKRLDRHTRGIVEHRRSGPGGIVVPDLDEGFGKRIGEDSVARADDAPAPARQDEVEKGDADGIARLRPVDGDRPRERREPAVVESGKIGQRGSRRDLAARRVDDLHLDGLARRHGQDRHMVAAPAAMVMAGVNRVSGSQPHCLAPPLRCPVHSAGPRPVMKPARADGVQACATSPWSGPALPPGPSIPRCKRSKGFCFYARQRPW